MLRHTMSILFSCVSLVSCGSIPVPVMESPELHTSLKQPEEFKQAEQSERMATGPADAQSVTDSVVVVTPAVRNQITVPVVQDEPPGMPAGLEDARLSIKEGRYKHAVGLLEVITREHASETYRGMLRQAYIGLYRQYTDRQDYADAKALLSRALAFLPGDKELQHLESGLLVKQQSISLYQRGVNALKQGSTEKAISLLRQTLALDPGHSLANNQINQLKARFLDDYYRQAMVYYRAQELDKAIGTWDKVLSLEPSHEKARHYRHRALTLKQKLERL